MDGLTDEELMVLVKHGRWEAFDVLYERHRRGLFAYLLRMCQVRTVAEEAMQDVLLKVARAADRYEPRGRFLAWLYRIATNHASNLARSSLRRADAKVVSLIEVPGEVAGLPAAPESQGPPARVEARQARESVLAALATLDVRHRSVLVLRDVVGMSLAEIADALGMPLGTVKTHVHRGRERLRRRLEAATDGEGAEVGR